MPTETNIDYDEKSDKILRITTGVMDVTGVSPVKVGGLEVFQLTGTLLVEPKKAYAFLSKEFQKMGYTPMLREEGSGAAVVVIPGMLNPSESRLWLAILLFGITIVSTIFVGGLQADGFSLGLGLLFSASLLSILLAHELGHYLVARHIGVKVSYPFFIPMPFSIIGTMGAFISMKTPPPDRRALLSIAIAGPLAGFVVAVPVLALGLHLSEVGTLETLVSESHGAFIEGNSLLYAGLKMLMFGQFLPSETEDVFLHPVAFAGWVGLLVTGLNLIPAGQLDGGHILYALVGSRIARMVTWGIALFLVVMGFSWPGWFIWAILITLLGQVQTPLLNELVPLKRKQQVLAVVGLIIFVLVFTPTPFTQLP